MKVSLTNKIVQGLNIGVINIKFQWLAGKSVDCGFVGIAGGRMRNIFPKNLKFDSFEEQSDLVTLKRVVDGNFSHNIAMTSKFFHAYLKGSEGLQDLPEIVRENFERDNREVSDTWG